jgi:protein phosphatase
MGRRRSGSSLTIPLRTLVVLVGPSGSGKSTFARKHFGPFEIVSSDHCRALVCDDEADQAATAAAFELLHHIVGKRLEFGRLTVVDATNVEAHARRPLLMLAREHRVSAVAIVFKVGEDTALARNSLRPNRMVDPAVVRRQHDELRSSGANLAREGFSRVHVLRDAEEVSTIEVVVGSRNS